MNKINILYIFNDDGFGGAGQSLLDTLSGVSNIVNPTVIIRDDADVIDKFVSMGIQCYKIRFLTDFAKTEVADDALRAYDIVQSYEAALQLLPIIKKENIDLIHINSSVSSFAAIAAIMAGIPYVWHIRELLEEQFGCEFINEKLKIFLFSKADRLISISDFVQKKYLEKYGLETTRIYNGVDAGRFLQGLEEGKVLNPVFIVPGAITPEKGQWDIVKAVEILKERGYSDVKVTIIGNGDTSFIWAMKKYIHKKNLEGNIQILPFCNDLSSLRRKASYAITSSQNEALGRVTIEAMLAGNLVIGAASGGTIEIIGENEERGLLYELHNSEALAETMIKAMELPDDVKNRMRETAQAYAEDTFDSKSYGRTIINLYQEILDTHILREKSIEVFLTDLKRKYETARNMDTEDEKQAEEDLRYQKSEKALRVAVKWLEVRQNGHNLAEYLKGKNIHSVAIYGMAALGRRFYDELEREDIQVRYLLDRNPGRMNLVLEFTPLDGERMDVDAVIVTVAGAEEQIIKEIKRKGYPQVIGLSEIISNF